MMLLPSVLVLHEVRRRFAERELPRTPVTFVALTLLMVAALLFVRGEALRGLTARRVPTVSLAVDNYIAGLYRVFCLAPADRPWQRVASGFVMLLPLAAALLWRRTTGRSRALLVSGASIALLFNLPFVFVTKPEQLHLVALGGAVVLAASTLSLLDAIPSRPGLVSIGALIAAAAAALAVVSINITRDFEPFGPIVLSHDDIVRGWAAVPPEMRAYLARKREFGARHRLSSNPAVALERITFGTHGREIGRDGVIYQWMSGPQTDILLAPRVRTVTIPLRHAIEVFRDAVHVTIRADGRIVDQLDLKTPDWRTSETVIGLVRASWRGGMHRVAIRIDRTWTPSDIIPGSTDGRVLGLQIGEITTRPALPITTTDAPR